MRVFAKWEVSDELLNELLRHLNEFEKAHPGCGLEVFVQSTPAASMAQVLREPASSVTQILERRGPDGPKLSPFERAMEAVRDNPSETARAIAKRIGVSHQTVGRAKAELQGATAPAMVQERDRGPVGPRRWSRP